MHIIRAAVIAFILLPAAGLGQDDWSLVRSRTLAEIAQIADSCRGIFGLAVIDLASGDTFGIRDTLVYPQGSSIKVPVLMELYRQAHKGLLSLTDRLPVKRTVQVGGSGHLQYFGDGTSELSLRDLAVMMIIESDNTATNMLIDRLGMENVNAMLRSLSLPHTVLQRRMMDTEASGRGIENLSTPREAARIMELLYRGKIVTWESCAEMLDMLALPKSGDIRTGVPDSVRLAFKPGGIAGVTTEWALVDLKARPYIVAVMNKFGLGTDASAAIGRISTVLFEYFWRLGRSTRYGAYADPGLWK